MRWRCGARSGAMACMRRPGHTGDHQTAIVIDGTMGLLFWENQIEEEVESEEPELVILDEILPFAWMTRPREDVEYVPQPRIPRPDRDGVRPTMKTLRNMYAGFDDGMHLSWGLTGHEILPLPTLDEIEAT